MSFGSGDSTSVQFKNFVSEEELEEKRRIRQEEWEKVRRPDQPLEAPEEEVDTRSLYDRLQEQKQKKQDEYEEQFKLRNQVKGLEEDESEFLDFVSKRQQDLDKEREQENNSLLQEYREAVVNRVQPTAAAVTSVSSKPDKKPPSLHAKKSQTALLAGAIKRKTSSEATLENSKKRKGSESRDCETVASAARTVEIAGVTAVSGEVKGQTCQVLGILPGIGTYTDSEDSASSSASEDIDTDLFSTDCLNILTHQH